MLHPVYDAVRQELCVAWDYPPPESVREHSEYAVFFETLRRVPGLSPWRGGLHEAFTVPYAGLVETFASQLPQGSVACQTALCRALAAAPPQDRDQGLQINHHQHPFDTPKRAWRFVLNQGRFIDYFFNRLAWHLAPTYRMVAPFPLHVDIETASTCNMNCPMCYRRKLAHTGQMDVELFKSIVDECAANGVFSVRLSWRGEALTHPRIAEMIAYSASRIPNVSFLTNAFYLDDAIMDVLVQEGLSYLAVSFDGMGEIYDALRRPATFEDSRARLAALREKVARSGRGLPQVRLCTIWPAISMDPQAYYDSMSQVSDYIVCNPYINFIGDMERKPCFICQYPWERIVVAYDGDIQCCTGWNATDIILGNAAETSIREAWHSDRLERIRELHAGGERLSLASCAACRHGSVGDPDISIWEILERGY